jgi:threonine/homoserine/homoserine lactone efflux protein
MEPMTNLLAADVWSGSFPGLKFWIGYMALLCVPGPNMMLVATCVAASGIARSTPLLFSIAGGAATLAVLVSVVIGAALDDNVQNVLAPLSGVLMWLVALRTLRLRWIPTKAAQSRVSVPMPDMAVAFACGLTNPATGMFFSAYFISYPVDVGLVSVGSIFLGTLLCCVSVLSIAAALLATRPARDFTARHFVQIKIACAFCFLAFGTMSIGSGLHRLAAHV